MKFNITLPILIFYSISAHAQMEKTEAPPQFVKIGEAKSVGSPFAKFGYMIIDGDTSYAIYYHNLQYTHIVDVKSLIFANIDGTVDTLYKTLKTLISAEKGTLQSFKLGNNQITVTTIKVPGFKGINIKDEKTGASFGLNMRQLNALFAKKDE